MEKKAAKKETENLNLIIIWFVNIFIGFGLVIFKFKCSDINA